MTESAAQPRQGAAVPPWRSLDPTLTRGDDGRYHTADGHFRIGRTSERRWRITATGTSEMMVKMAADADRTFKTMAEAVEHMLGSIYAEPHGWAHHVEEAYELDRQRSYPGAGGSP